MTMGLSDKEAKTIHLARKYVKIQKVARYFVLALLVILFIASTEGIIDIYTFRALTMVIAVMLLYSPYSRLPSYSDLLSLLEQKVSESSEAIAAVSKFQIIDEA